MAGLPIVSPDSTSGYPMRASGPWQPGKLHWVPVGRDRGNGGRINLAGEPMNPLAERLVNGMEALIELAGCASLQKKSSAPCRPVRASGPALFRLPETRFHRASGRRRAQSETPLVRQGSQEPLDHPRLRKKSKQFAVTIRDHGMGQTPGNMHQTLLSLGRPIRPTSPTSLGFSARADRLHSRSRSIHRHLSRAADIRKPGDGDGAGWTIVREITKGRRDPYFAYLAATEDGGVRHVDAAEAEKASSMARSSATSAMTSGRSTSAITRTMYQSLNHVLFNPVLPL